MDMCHLDVPAASFSCQFERDCFRLSWHCWPVHSELAEAWDCPVLDASRLLKAHELVGSGFFLPASVAAVGALLATAHLFQGVPRIAPPPPTWTLIRVPQNGRCFVTCAYLKVRAPMFAQGVLRAWATCLRSPTSMPLHVRTGEVWTQRLKEEEVCTLFGESLSEQTYTSIIMHIYGHEKKIYIYIYIE